jgi:hypothetical protein
MRQQLAALGQFAGLFYFYFFLSYLQEVVIFERVTNNQVTNKQKVQDFINTKQTSFAQLQASASKQMRTALLWAITQLEWVIPYRRFGTTYRSHI